jgi:hypothetical protein
MCVAEVNHDMTSVSCKALQCSTSHVHQVVAPQLAVETIYNEKEVCLERWKEYSELDYRIMELGSV